MIKAVALTKQYGSVQALRDLNLCVPKGQILALVGPNGAGKTTALKLLVGLLTPSSGDAWIGPFHVLDQSLEAKRLLSFVPDQPFVYEQLTITEFLGFIAGMYQLAPEMLRHRADALLQLFDLFVHRHRRISQLSYGMKSRLVLIASLLHEPEALILDEPFFGLDPQTLRVMKRLLKERAAQGMAIMLSTHQLAIVEDLADEIAILRQGQLIALGSLESLRQQHGGSRLEDVFFHLTES